MALKTKVAGAAAASTRGDHGADPEGFFPAGWLIGSYFLLAVLFMLPALLPGVQLFGTDYLAVAYFWEQFVTDRFAAGELPKWLPYVYGGAPFYANPMDTYHPLTMLLRLAGVATHRHLAILFTVHLFLAGAGGYLLVRELGARRMPAYLSGLLYMFAGYIVSFMYGGHDGRAMVATVAPLFLFALHRGIRTGGVRWFVLGGVVLGSALLSFQIQSSYYLLLAGGLWFAHLLWHRRAYRPLKGLAVRVGGGALTLGIGFAMAAVNFLPFLGYVQASPRGGEGGRGYEYATSWAMPPEEIVGLAVPERIGILGQYFGENGIKLHTEYAGALAILLLVVGVYLLRRNRDAWYFFALSILTLTISFGGHTPIYRLYYEWLPGTDKFRAPSISFYLLTLSLAVLAGLALDRLATLREERASRSAETRRAAEATLRIAGYLGAGALALTLLWGIVVAGATPAAVGTPTTPEAYRAALAAANHPNYVLGVWRFALFLGLAATGLWFWVRGTIPTRFAGLLLAAITVVDLWIVDKKFFETVPEPKVHFAPDEVVDYLRAQPGPFRTFVLFDLPQDDYLTYFGLELIGGEHGNQLQSYNEFLGAGERTYTDYHNILQYPNFLALANARYLVTTDRIQASFLRPVFEGRVRDGRRATVYENTLALPRAFVVPTAVRVEGRDAALDRLRSPAFDPTREVLLYEDPPLRATEGTAAGTARVVRHDPAEVEVEVDVSGGDGAYLVLTDNYHEDWTAEVDGEPAPVLRAYHTFRAVPVPSGSHRVVFRFEPRSLETGFRIYLVVWAALAAYGVALLITSRRRAREAA